MKVTCMESTTGSTEFLNLEISGFYSSFFKYNLLTKPKLLLIV